MLVLFAFVGCTAPVSENDASDEGSDTASHDTGEAPPQPAALAELSSGECPPLDESATSTFISSDEDRSVTVIIPAEPTEHMPVHFFFHGLDDPAQTDHPGESWANGLDVQSLADETGTIWVFPDSPVQTLYGYYDVYLWDLAMETDHDVVLFDDLRTCIGQNLDVDLTRATAMGFSGGALFVTLLLSLRADTLATAVELSGGADIEAPGYDNLLAAYSTPASDTPVLLTTGGAADVWPNESMPVVDFYAASDLLQNYLISDGHFVVRCNDDEGHTVTRADWNLGVDWVLDHTYGEESPFEVNGLGDNADWCVKGEQIVME